MGAAIGLRPFQRQTSILVATLPLLSVLGQHHLGAAQFRAIGVGAVIAVVQQLSVAGIGFLRLMGRLRSLGSAGFSGGGVNLPIPVPVRYGGTGLAPLPANAVRPGEGRNPLRAASPDPSGYVLTNGGPGSDPIALSLSTDWAKASPKARHKQAIGTDPILFRTNLAVRYRQNRLPGSRWSNVSCRFLEIGRG